MYFIFKEVRLKNKWHFSFIGIKEIENIPDLFNYIDNLYCYLKPLKHKTEDYIAQIALVHICDIFNYICQAESIINIIYKKLLIEYIKINYPNICLMIELKGV